MPCVDVLTQQRDLTGALADKVAGLPQNRRGGAALFGAAGVWHNAEAAKLIATFLDGQKRGDALRSGAIGEVVELVLRREIRLDHLAAGAGCSGDHFRQPMIRLRPQHDIDIGRAGKDFRALGLSDTAGDRQDHPAVRRFLHPAQAPKLREDLLRRLVANVAGVQDHHVGAVWFRYAGVAQRRQHVGHPPAVIHVHLAAPGDDVQTFTIARGAIGLGHQSGSPRPCRTISAGGAGEMIGPTSVVKRNNGLGRDGAWMPPQIIAV